MPSILQRLKSKLPLTDMATSDRQVLLFCIGLALIFWVILNLSQDYEITREIKLNYSVVPERVIAGTPPTTVTAQIAGRGWDLLWESLRGSKLDVTVDVGDAPDLQLTTSLLRQQISRQLSSGDLEVEGMDYESRPILTTPREGKRVPVVSRVTTTFVSGYFAPGGLRFQPDSVTVNGATDVLEEITEWPTAAISVKRLKDPYVTSVALEEPPPGIELSQTSVMAEIDVDAFIEQQHRVPVTLINAPASDSARVFPEAVTVTVTLSRSAYGNFKPSDFRIEADIANMQRADDHNSLPLKLARVPDDIRSISFTPRAVEYYVYRKED